MFDSMFRVWRQVGFAEEPFTFQKKFTYKSSPDAITWRMLQKTDKEFRSLYKKLAKVSQRKVAPMQCQPTTPQIKGDCERFLTRK